ncbi:chorismate mutase [Endozoicomonas sp. SESOKO1]|uniref:chorismate mutase n=1 Tax=Endozoicomonas sp. SESOKO1 TaxID=2828742 RepID=UPI00214788F0|nr:chorismate mutase [Endozoicomonas sp. SESOKO1]
MDGPSADNYQPTTTSPLLTQTEHLRTRDDLPQRQTANGITPEGSPLMLRRAQGTDLSDNARHKISNLFHIINKRLNMMPEMAQLKLRLEQPVFDRSREQLVMGKALNYADSINLDRELVQRFIQSQMDIARLLQEQEQTPSPLDAEQAALRKQELRNSLIAITPKMLDTLKEIQDDLELVAFRTAIQTTLSYEMKGLPLQNKHLQEIVFWSLYPGHAS